jgi:hypothetical protein
MYLLLRSRRKFVNKDDSWTTFPRYNIFELRGCDEEVR